MMGGKKKAKAVQNKPMLPKEEPFDVRLATILMAKGFVTSPEESSCLAESICAEIEESELSREESCISSFEDYFSMSRHDARAMLSTLLNLPKDDKSEDSFSDKSAEDVEDEDDDNDDGDYIGEGECELCERYIRLTKHHLIPRSTWPRILPRLTNAAEALSKNDVHRAGLILGSGLVHLLEPLTRAESDKSAIKGLLKITCSICSPCHGTIHRTYENMTLATNYSTTELLLRDEKIYKFCKWVSKQKPGKYSV